MSYLETLKGEQLTAVSFVMDYVEFHFSLKVLTALTSPGLRCLGRKFRFPEPGSRDALCSLIGKCVQSTLEKEESLTIVFDNNETLTISLLQVDGFGPEAAYLVEDGNIAVWETIPSLGDAEAPTPAPP